MVKLFEIKTAFLERESDKREIMYMIVPRSNSLVSKTHQRTKTDKEVNGPHVGKKKGTVLCVI